MEKNPFKRTVSQCAEYIKKHFSDALISGEVNTDTVVNSISYNSAETAKNDIFICKGKNFKKRYLEEALEKGAICAVIPNDFSLNELSKKYSVVFIRTKYTRWVLAELSAFFYDFPMRKLTTIAVTGTKGKSGTVEMIKNVLNGKNGIRAANVKECMESSVSLTTPEAPELHRAALNALNNGKTHLVCEVSSQAIKHLRICGVTFDIGCFLNFSPDHISPSEHSCVEEYFLCKTEMVLNCKRVICNKNYENKFVISNICEKYRIPITIFSASSEDADIYAKNISPSESGYSFSVFSGKDLQGRIYLPHFGNYNTENALCAYAVGNMFDIPFRDIFRALVSSWVLGRGEMLSSCDGNIRLIVDYAHNGISFRKVFEETKRRFPDSRITAVFGCPGGKAVVRRYQLPCEALKYADRMIICEDDSGKEGFERIVSEVLSNIDEIIREFPEKERIKKAASVSVFKDRAKAIENAVNSAFENREKRVILILGRGNDTVMRTEKGNIRYVSDIELAKIAMERIDKQVSVAMLAKRLKKQDAQRVLIHVAPDPFMIKKLSASLAMLGNEGVRAAICCRGRYTDLLRENLFKEGIPSHICSCEREYKRECEYCFRAGVVPVFVCDKTAEETVQRILEAVSFDKAVYMTDKKGILIEGKTYISGLAYRNAVLLQANTNTKELKLLTGAIERGVSEAAVLNGNTENALAFYLCGGRICGTEVKKID